MPRNSAGVYSLPAGNPVVSGSTISSSWANTTLSDLATAMTGSLARNGDGGMTGQLKADSGSGVAPGLAWAAETTAGWYRAGTSDFRFTIAGTDVVTVTAAGISATLSGNGSGLTNLNASNLGSGTVPDARFPATLPAVSGANLTNLNASNIGSGTLADARLSSNVPLLDASNTFTNLNTLSSTNPRLRLYDSNAGTDAKYTEFNGNSGFSINLLDDSAANPVTALSIARSGTSVTGIVLNAPVTATSFTGSGSGLSGIPDGALSSNVPLKNATNTFTNTNIFNSNLALQQDDTRLVVDGSGLGRLGIVKKTGETPKIAVGSSATFHIARSSSSNIWSTAVSSQTFTDALSMSANGNWTFAAPSSGTALTVTGAAASAGVRLDADNTYLELDGTGSRFALQAQNGSAGFRIYDLANSAERFSVNNSGNVAINAPSSGVALTVLGNVNTISANGSGTSLKFYNNSPFITGNNIASETHLAVGTQSGGSYNLSLVTNALTRVAVNSSGNVTVNAPSSGISLTTSGAASSATEVQRWTDGTRSASLYLNNTGTPVQFGSAGAVALFSNTGTNRITLDTGLQVGSPTGGDKGAGTLNTAGSIYKNNVLVESLPAVTSTSTTLVKGQAHYITGNATLPALAAGEWIALINNSGSAITITENSGDTTYWTASGASVSTVTLSARGRLFAEGVGSTTVYVSGDISGST